MKRFFTGAVCILLILIFLAAVVYLPEVDAMILEKQYMKQYVLVKQDKQGQGIHYELPLVDKLYVLTYGQYPTEIMSIHSITNLEVQDEALLEGLQRQISILEKAEIIPGLVEEEQLQKGFQEAVYYNIGTVDNPSMVVPVWKLVFYDEESFRYEFIIDAGTYKIYSADLYGYGVYDFWLNKGVFIENLGTADEEMAWKLENKLEGLADKLEEQLRIYYEAKRVENEYLNFWESCGFESMLFYENAYVSFFDRRDTIEIPCQVYYIPEEKERMHIGIAADILGEEEAMSYDSNTEINGKNEN